MGETLALRQSRARTLNEFLSNRQMAVLFGALTAIAVVVGGGFLVLTDQLFQARLQRASAVPTITDMSSHNGSTSRSFE